MPAIPHLPSRHVRRLHVRAAAEDDARHAATLLDDALRTASLGVADAGRFVAIRRLPLGRISTRVSAASLALHIERVAAEVMADAVAGHLPAAASANAVTFATRSDAIVALARAHAAGMSATEWFWPRVMPGWRGDLSRGAKWALLLDAAHRSPESVIVAAAVVEHAIAAGVVDEILAGLSQRQAIGWLQLGGWSSIAPAGSGPMWRRPDGHRGETLRRWRAAWDATDARLVWLATLMSVTERSACAADPRLPGRIAFALRSLDQIDAARRAERLAIDTDAEPRGRAGIAPRRSGEPASKPGASSVDRRGTALDGEDGSPTAPLSHSMAAPAAAGGQPLQDHETRVLAGDVADQPVDEYTQPLVAASTAFGGLLFLVRVLEQLGFSAFVAEHPALLESAFPARLLLAIGQRAGMPENDPLALALRVQAGQDSDGTASIDMPIKAWRLAVRRWCRRYPRIALSTLLRRRATVHVSRTHIDAHFALSDLDVRVRRWALDVDPGWVPWLGRVITFTYGDNHDAR